MPADTRTMVAVLLGIVGAGLAGVGTFLTWFRIEIGGIAAPGGSATGWDGQDGRTVLAGGVVALLAAVVIVLGRRGPAARVALLAAGGVTAVVAVAGIVDASSKADEVEDRFGIASERVVGEVGTGLWVVAAAGAAELAAGIAARHDPEGGGVSRRWRG